MLESLALSIDWPVSKFFFSDTWAYLQGMESNPSLKSDHDKLMALSAQLQEAVGHDHFEAECLQILKASHLLPIAVAHCFAFNPATGRSTITDQSGEVEKEDSPISAIIDRFSVELPKFKAAVEQSEQLVSLASLQSPEEIARSTIFQQVIQPYGLADLLHLPLMQANTRFSVMAGSPRAINENDRVLALLVQRHIVAAMSNHHWLRHAEANGRNIEAVSGRSVILPIEAAPPVRICNWSEAVAVFEGGFGPKLRFPKAPMPQLENWLQLHCESYPLQATDLNRAEFALDASKRTGHSLHAVFLGDRNLAHRLLLYRPVGVPDALGLTSREKSVLAWICRGKSNEGVAVILGISKNTVRNHISRILTKLHTETRSEAASMARGWFED